MTDIAAFEQDLRSSLDKAGLIQRMKALFMDAALDCISKSGSSSKTDPKLLKPSQALLDAQETESFGTGMALVVDFLRQYGLLHTLNCLKTESGMFPEEEEEEETPEMIAEERKELCLELQVSTERSALEMMYEKSKICEMTRKPAPLVDLSAVGVTKPISPDRSVAPAAGGESPSDSFTNSSASSTPARAAAASASVSPAKAASAASSPGGAVSSASSSPARVNYPSGGRPSTAVIKHSNGKARETTYTVEWFDGGEFVRYNQITGQQFVIEYMRNCRILIFDAVDSITMDDCEDCELVVAACENSIFLRTCTNCNFTIACKQLRTRDCKDCNINLFTTTDPVVEASTHMHFFPFNLASPNLVERFKAVKFNAAQNRFVHVFDFTADDTKLHGGGRDHFTVHWPDHSGTVMQRYGEAVDFEHVNSPPEIEMLLTGDIEPAASLEKGAGKSMNIKTGANQWQGQQQQPAATAAPPAAVPEAKKQPTPAPASNTTTTAAAVAKAAVPALKLGGVTTAGTAPAPSPKKAAAAAVDPAAGAAGEFGGILRKGDSDSSIDSYSDDYEDEDDTF